MRYRYPFNTRVFPFFQSVQPIQLAQLCGTKFALVWTPRRMILAQRMDTTVGESTGHGRIISENRGRIVSRSFLSL
jgi:hypothetical protein